MDNNEFPLYPKLTEQGEIEAQALMERFKEGFKKVADEVLGEIYCDIALYIESDSWGNFRNEIMEGFKDYENRKIQSEWDFKTIRAEIFKNHKEAIIKDINQDNLNEIERLKKELKRADERYDQLVNRSY